MHTPELLKVAYFIGLEYALREAGLEKHSAMERILLSAADIAKSKAAREAAQRAAKKPGFFARLFGLPTGEMAKKLEARTVLDVPTKAITRQRQKALRAARATA